jgi:hypothetical protein
MLLMRTDETVIEASLPHRRLIVGVESFVAVGGLMGSVQLMSGTFTPPVSDLEPLGLSSWVLPGFWLVASVVVPSGMAAWLAWRRSRWARVAVPVASVLLGIEVLVQIPFVGFNAMQLVFRVIAVVMATVAWRGR